MKTTANLAVRCFRQTINLFREQSPPKGKLSLMLKVYHRTGVLSIEKKLTPQERYDRANTTRYQLKLNNKTDKDIIQKLSSVKSKQGYIKECIRKDISN